MMAQDMIATLRRLSDTVSKPASIMKLVTGGEIMSVQKIFITNLLLDDNTNNNNKNKIVSKRQS